MNIVYHIDGKEEEVSYGRNAEVQLKDSSDILEEEATSDSESETSSSSFDTACHLGWPIFLIKGIYLLDMNASNKENLMRPTVQAWGMQPKPQQHWNVKVQNVGIWN